MNRAFVKGDESDRPEPALPERALGEPPHYITPAGLAQLRTRFDALRSEHATLKQMQADPADRRLLEIERDLRYLRARLDGAVVVDVAAEPRDEVHFGATVTTVDAHGTQARFTIVGDDEADVAHGKISFRSPLARALMGARAGETVRWQRPAGDAELSIAGIDYGSSL